MLRVSAYSSRELLLVLRGLRSLDRETKKQTRLHLKPMVMQAWQEAIASRASTPLERVMLVETARVRVSDQNVRLTSATIGRSRSGGLKASEAVGPVEFGASPNRREVHSTRRGTAYKSTRNTHAPFKTPNRKGYVVYPAIAEVVPRVLSMYVQTFLRAIHEALEGKIQ